MRRAGSRRRMALIAGVTVMLGAMVPGPAAAADPLPRGTTDISHTARGRQLLADAADRFERRGVPRQRLRAIRDAFGVVVVPARSGLRSMPTRSVGGQPGVRIAPVTVAAPARSGLPESRSAAALGSWQLVGSSCFSRITDSWTWLDHCYQMFKLTSDGSGTRDYFALSHYATVHPNSPWVANAARISSRPTSTSAPQTWVDWHPRTDWTGGCQTTTVGVASPVGGIGVSVDRCDRWDFTKWNPAVRYELLWLAPGTRADRELAYQISVSVGQGRWPQWVLPAETFGSAF